MTPAKKFWKISLKANPTATETRPAAERALAGVRPGNTIMAAEIKPKIQMLVLINLTTSWTSDGRIFVLPSVLLAKRVTAVATSQVKTMIARAPARKGRCSRNDFQMSERESVMIFCAFAINHSRARLGKFQLSF